MNTYEIIHGPGDTEIVTAASVEHDAEQGMFYLKDDTGQTVAWIPILGGRGIRLQQPS